MVDRMPFPRGDRNLRIELGRVRLPWEQVAKLGPGSVVSLETLVDEPVDIVVESQIVARGEVLVLDGCFCIRVTELVAKRDAA
jgi:flagellar motor switch protein FliN/FliY